jgi:hypothetical protein
MKEIPGYNGKYKINESGIVINENGHTMRTAVSNSGYLRTALEDCDDGHRKNESIHRLVAKTFIPNPDNLPVVMHKDNDKLNNHVSNLKWGTQSDNISQAFREDRKSSPAKSVKIVNIYEVYNDDEDRIVCNGRSEVSDLIGYEEISLKNMVGNGRKIAFGPYAGYMIDRTGKKIYRNMVRIVQ